MSDVTVKIELPPESQALIKKFQDMPQELPKAVKRGMDFALSVVRGRIQANRLSGKGPYPPSEHRLGFGPGKGNLARSLREEPAVIRGQEVTGAIGSNVFYGKIHEFGVRYTSRKGKAVDVPERAPVRTGINENAEFIAGEISKAIGDELKKKP
jgi:hypothetical protein